MIDRRQFMKVISATGAAFAVSGHMILGEGSAMAQETAPVRLRAKAEWIEHEEENCDQKGHN